MRAFIFMRDRLHWPMAMAERLAADGCRVILLDNASTYPPLLEWYRRCPHKVVRLKQNAGDQCYWRYRLNRRFGHRHYLCTDPDLDLSGLPGDWLKVLWEGWGHGQDVAKVGLGLKIDDLPDQSEEPFRSYIGREAEFHDDTLSPAVGRFRKCRLGSTLAMYDQRRLDAGVGFFTALRAEPPYVVRHLPWYLKPGDPLPEDEAWYRERASLAAFTTYTRMAESHRPS